MRNKLALSFILLLLLVLKYQLVLALPVQSREMQVLNIKGYNIAVDNDPAWNWKVKYNKDVPVFIAQTPEKYYPPATVNVRYHKDIMINDHPAELRSAARSAIKTSLQHYDVKDINVNNSMRKVTYRQVKGYELNVSGFVNGDEHDIKIVVVRNVHGKMMSFLVYTSPGKMDHIQAAVKRIFNSVSFLRKY